MIVDKDGPRPTKSMVEKAWGQNDDGAGIAWREKNSKGEPIVHWKKGLDEKEMADLVEKLPMPFVAHWRIASSGGILDELTHPFPIEPKASLALEGKTKNSVLFHNGTWSNWDELTRYACVKKDVQTPAGKWSDSRAMAWLCSLYGLNFMELLPLQRGVAFGPEDMEVFIGPGWSKVNDIWCSNNHFMNHHSKSHHQSYGTGYQAMCQYAGCVRTNIDGDKRCPTHPKTSFPTNGYESQNKAPAVATASQTPFCPTTPGAIISVELAEMLHRQITQDGQRRLSKSKLKEVRKFHTRIALGGVKAEKARRALELLSQSLLPLCGLPR